MLSRLYGDIISYNALLNACDKGQQWMLALNLLETMSNESVLADVGSSQSSMGCGLVMQIGSTEKRVVFLWESLSNIPGFCG